MTPLQAVTNSANTSYKNGPGIDDIREMLETGILKPVFLVHVFHVLTETPREIVMRAAIEVTGSEETALENLSKLEIASLIGES